MSVVSSVSATEYTVYFKPSTNWKLDGARFVFNTLDKSNEENQIWVRFSSYSTGIYSATYDTDLYTGRLIICRMNGSSDTDNWDNSNKWAQTGDLSAPTTNVYYMMTGSDWSTDIATVTPSSKTFTIINYDCEADILPNFMDANSSGDNNLTSNGDFTYSRTVTGNVVRNGSYGFKLSDEGSNTYDNSGSAWSVSDISQDGVYTIEYSFNYITGVASATAEKTGNATITEKYVVAGSEELTGYDWDTTGDNNVMTVSEGVGTLSYDDANLVANSNSYKIVRLMCNNGTTYRTEWKGDPNNYNENYTKNIVRTSIYDVEFTYTISTGVATCECTEVDGFFLYGGTSGWGLGQRMTESNGVYTATITNNPGYAFVVVPTSNLKGDNTVNDWSAVVRPVLDANNRVCLSFANYSGTSSANQSSTIDEVENRHAWEIQKNTGYNDANDADVTITYTPALNAWAVTCADMEVSINSDGYATYSNKYPYQVSGATNLYTVSTYGTNSVTLTNHESSTKFYGGAAIIIKGDPSSTVYIKALNDGATTDEIGINYLHPSNNATLSLTSTADDSKYIFTKKNSVVGFYKAATGTGTLGAHKAYLDLSTYNAREFLAFDFEDGETTSVDVRSKMEDVRGEYFDLQGRRVAQPTKGLYIVNGKKVIVK